SGIQKDLKLENVKDSDYKKAYKNLILLLHKDFSANSVGENIYPFIMESQSKNMKEDEKESKITKYDSFSDAIRKNYDTIKHHENKKGHGKNIDKIQNVINEQQKVLDEAQQGYETNQRKAELIYEKYQQVDNIIKALKEIRSKHSWSEIRQKLKNNPELSRLIKDIDEKNNSVIIDLE
ncbi:MAG TPA: hypothetical protein VEC16_04800, partial [Alphaproteobacteria bacterium]|nr:hypothetical protein [Alphaproteobacteria bacterium]